MQLVAQIESRLRPNVGARSERVAHFLRFHQRDTPLGKRRDEWLDDNEALGVDAALARVNQS